MINVMKIACQRECGGGSERHDFFPFDLAVKQREVFSITKYQEKFNKHIFESERDWNDKVRQHEHFRPMEQNIC